MEICKNCGSNMKLVPAGQSKKYPYKEYDAFWSCPNNREKGCKTMPFKTSPEALKSPPANEKLKDESILVEKIDYLLEELQPLIKFMKEQLLGE